MKYAPQANLHRRVGGAWLGRPFLSRLVALQEACCSSAQTSETVVQSTTPATDRGTDDHQFDVYPCSSPRNGAVRVCVCVCVPLHGCRLGG